MSIRLLLFGAPTLESGGESFVLPFERRNQLLVFLALRRAWVGRAELAALLWPEQESKLAYSNLRKTLFRLQAQPWAHNVEVRDAAVRVEAQTDVGAFEAALREQRLADALLVRRGELLAGFDDEAGRAWAEWLGFERDRLRVAWRRAALERLAADIDAAEAIDLSARLLEADSLDEAALRAHMAWLARDGQTGRARQAYQEFAARLAQDLAIAPGAELKALHDSLGTSAPPGVPLAPAVAAADDDFVGRSVELRRVAALLAQDDCRLLCLIGPGGVGKTRLAQRAIRELAAGFRDGAAFVALEDVAAPGELGTRLARELGLRLAGSAEPLDQVLAFLRDRQMLLVLDNFEQLVTAAAILEKLLRSATGIRIVVTSRVRLAVSMEWLLPIEGLPFPEAGDEDRIEAFDAVRLFVNTARRVQPALSPAAEAAAIVDICRQVEGLPLALQIAAAWTRVLSCEAIATELRKGLDLLRVVDPTRPARHASMEAVFDQSWAMLTAAERDALARLSVFRGSFSSEAARAVAGASLPVLAALVDKSLLRREGARIFLHPLVHQLAAARLAGGEARAATHAAHAAYFHRLLAQLRRRVADGDRESLLSVETEFENCRSAWQWAAANGQIEPLTRSALTLLEYCDHRGRHQEALALLREAIASPPTATDRRHQALLSSAAAHLEYRLDRYREAEATATRALAAARALRDRDTRLQCHKVLGGACLRLGRLDDARRHFNEALKLAPEDTDPHNAAAMLDNLAIVEKAMGRYDEALRLSTQSLVRHRLIGDVAGEALCLNNLGTLHVDRGEYESADVQLRAGLALCERHGLLSTHGLILANLTDLATKTGDHAAAEAYARLALDLGESTGNRALTAILRIQFVRFALRRADLPAARTQLRAAMETALAIGRPTLLAVGVAVFAEILAAQGLLDSARAVLTFAASQPSLSGPHRAELEALLQQWGPAAGALPAWPAIELVDLAHRIVVETDLAHEPLIALLRGRP